MTIDCNETESTKEPNQADRTVKLSWKKKNKEGKKYPATIPTKLNILWKSVVLEQMPGGGQAC